MAKYVGLTDNPQRRRIEHGNPLDWAQIGPFPGEAQARFWEKLKLAEGHQGGPGGRGWRFGYMYTITPYTKED